jgi:CRP-like cAMP-binding protein
MSDARSDLGGFARKLALVHPLDAEDRAAILALPHVRRMFEPAAYIIREGERLRRTCSVILSGYAFRQKLMIDGSRQIVSLHLPGEPLDLQHLFLDCADHNVQALTPLVAAEIDRDALRMIVLSRPAVARAVWAATLIEASIFREWIANVGRRDARGRIAHLMCEFKVRMDAAGLAPDGRYELPMTQEQIGDATGLTSVHVNRTLRRLREAGLVTVANREVRIHDLPALAALGEFDPDYLFLDNGDPPTP